MIQTESGDSRSTEKSGELYLMGELVSVDFHPEDFPARYLVTVSVLADKRLGFRPSIVRIWFGDCWKAESERRSEADGS